MKKLISVLLVAVMVFTAGSSVLAAYNATSTSTGTYVQREYISATVTYLKGNVLYTMIVQSALPAHTEGDHYVIDGFNMSDSNITRVIIPSTYNGKGIMLAEKAFSGINAAELVFADGFSVLPSGLCRDSIALRKVVIPQSVREIGSGAFKNCTNLYECSDIYAETIGADAFAGCTNLSVTVKNARIIGARAFEGCLNVRGVQGYAEEVEFVNDTVTIDGITYTLKNDEVWVTGCDKTAWGEIIIPSKVNQYPVTQIAYKGFYDCAEIKKVVLPETIKGIGEKSFFACSRLEEVLLNKGIEAIGTEAFAYCGQLKSIVIPDTVTTINDMAFRGSGLENIEIGTGVTFIGDGAFWDCDSLVSIVLPDNVKVLGTDESLYTEGYFGGERTDKKLSPFYGCDNLTSITIGKGIERIYPDMFYWCNELVDVNISAENPSYISVDGVVYTKDMKTLVCYPMAKSYGVYTICEGVCEIAEKAISGRYLKELYMPHTIEKIHDNNQIPEKTNIYENIEDVPKEAKETHPVEGIYNGINWKLTNEVLYITGSGTLTTTLSNMYTPVPWKKANVKEVVISEGIREIRGVFKDHVSLEKISLPETLEKIGDLSFCNCTSLESVSIPQRVTYIGVMAFSGCYKLKDIKAMGAQDLEILNGAFDVADGAVIYMPDNVKWIDKFAFTHIYSTGNGALGANAKPQAVTIVAAVGGNVYTWATENNVSFRTPLSVEINGSIFTGSNVYEENNAVYIAGKALFNELGIIINCDDERKVAMCGSGTEYMIFRDNTASVATGKGVVTLKNPARWIDGVFMIPAEAISSLGLGEALVTESYNVIADGEGDVGGIIPIDIGNITVSQLPEPENNAFNMIDGQTTTRWAAEVTDKNNPCWAIFDLGEVYKLDKIGLSFYRDLIRTTEFAVMVSVDGTEYTPAIERRNTPGISEEIEYYKLNGIEARYVKLLGYGNSSPYSNIMNWFSPTEVEIYKQGTINIVAPEENTPSAVDANGKFDLKMAKISASIISEPQNGPDKLCDNSLSTYCVIYINDSAKPEFMQIDLGAVYDISRVALAFRLPKERTTYFDIRISEDGLNYTTVVPKSGSDMSADPYEYFSIYKKARYIRIYGYSNTYNQKWVSVTDAQVYVNN